MDRNNICFFPFSSSVGNSPCFIQDWNIKSKGLQMDLPHSFNKQMLNMSWPWALLGPRFWIIVAISSLVKVTVEIGFFVLLQRMKGSLLKLFIIEHCLAKKQLNSSAFFLKSVTYLFQWMRGGIRLIVLLFNDDFNIEQ